MLFEALNTDNQIIILAPYIDLPYLRSVDSSWDSETSSVYNDISTYNVDEIVYRYKRYGCKIKKEEETFLKTLDKGEKRLKEFDTKKG